MERGASESEDEVIGSKDIFDVVICCILLSSPLPLYTHTHTQLSEASLPGAGIKSYSYIERRQRSPYKQVL